MVSKFVSRQLLFAAAVNMEQVTQFSAARFNSKRCPGQRHLRRTLFLLVLSTTRIKTLLPRVTFRIFSKVLKILSKFCLFLKNFSDVLRPIRTCFDAFAYVRIHSEATRCLVGNNELSCLQRTSCPARQERILLFGRNEFCGLEKTKCLVCKERFLLFGKSKLS